MRKKKWKKLFFFFLFFLFFLFVLFFVFCFTHSLDSAVEVENALGRFGDKVLEAEEGLLVLHVSRNLVADLVAHSLSLAAHCFVSLSLSLSLSLDSLLSLGLPLRSSSATETLLQEKKSKITK